MDTRVGSPRRADRSIELASMCDSFPNVMAAVERISASNATRFVLRRPTLEPVPQATASEPAPKPGYGRRSPNRHWPSKQ